MHVRECHLELMSGCQLVAEVSRSHGRTGPGPGIAHTSVADGRAPRSRLASRLGAYQARGHRVRLSAMVYATIARSVCLGLTRAHTVPWPRVWLVGPSCICHPKAPPCKSSAWCWISYSACDALFPHPKEGRHSILRAGQTPCELAHPSGVLHQSMASYCGALAREGQCSPPIGLEQRPSN